MSEQMQSGLPNAELSEGVLHTIERVRKAISIPTAAPMVLWTLCLVLWGMNDYLGWSLAIGVILMISLAPLIAGEKQRFPVRHDVFTVETHFPMRSMYVAGILPVTWINEGLFSFFTEGNLNEGDTFLPHYHLTGGFFLALFLALIVSGLYSYGIFGHHTWSYYPKARAAVAVPSGITQNALTTATPDVDEARNRILAALHTADAYTGRRVFQETKLQDLTSLSPELFREALGLLEKDDVVEISNRFVDPMVSINPSAR